MKATILLLFLLIGSAFATIREVPQHYSTIAGAMSRANDFDTILVAPGVYYERIFVQRPITLASHYLINPDTGIIRLTVIELPLEHFSLIQVPSYECKTSTFFDVSDLCFGMVQVPIGIQPQPIGDVVVEQSLRVIRE